MNNTLMTATDQATVPAPAVKTRLVLRTCNAHLTSHGGFQWPANGFVQAPDFEATYKCGHGLHGLLEGKGEGAYLDWNPEAHWLVVEVEEHLLLTGQGELCDKCKFPEGNVVHCGTQTSALDYLQQHGVDLTGCTGAIITVGDHGTATVGEHGIAMAGYRGTAIASGYGTAIAGLYGIATAGYKGTAVAQDYGKATVGFHGTATAGYHGIATTGNEGTATAGNYGIATAGNYGTATAGNFGRAVAGNYGTAAAGCQGTVSAGKNGIIISTWFDTPKQDYRTIVRSVGKNGIKANTPYKVNAAGKFIQRGEPK